MRLVTFRRPAAGGAGRLCVGRVEGLGDADDTVVELGLDGVSDVGQLLGLPSWRRAAESADGPRHRLGELHVATLIPRPGKIVCVGLNYRPHILEMGRELPTDPTLFAKFAGTLTGPYDEIELPPEDPAVDWEGELAVVIGTRCRRVAQSQAAGAIAGFTIANDVSMRTWQFRTNEWLQGKVWEASTPVGPWLVTADEWQPGPRLTTRLNGDLVQAAATDELLFGPEALVAYISTMITLEPGDLLLTGTPGGVGRAMVPPRYLRAGDVVEVEIDGLGALRSTMVGPAAGR